MSSASPTLGLSTATATQPPGTVNLPLAVALPICLFFFVVVVIVVVVVYLAKRKSCFKRSFKPNSSATSRGSVDGSSDLGDNNNDPGTGKHHSNENLQAYETVHSYEPEHEDHVSHVVANGTILVSAEEDKDNGWFCGSEESSKQIGSFQKSHVTEISENISEGQRSSSSVSEDDVDDDVTAFECQALFPYTGSEGQDLTFNTGDRIIAWKTLESGWWYGKCGDNVGWFPGPYVKKLSELGPIKPSDQAVKEEEIPDDDDDDDDDDMSTHLASPQQKEPINGDVEWSKSVAQSTECPVFLSKPELSIVSEELDDSDFCIRQDSNVSNSEGILQEASCPSTINGDGPIDTFDIQTDFPQDGFPSDCCPEKSTSQSGKRNLVSQLSLSKLVKFPGLHKLKRKKSSDVVLGHKQIFETPPSQIMPSSSEEVPLPLSPTARKAPSRPTQPPPEIPKISLSTSAYETFETSTVDVETASFENAAENSVFHEKHEFSGEISSARSTKVTDVEFVSSGADYAVSGDVTNDIDGDVDINAVVTPPPPDEFATVDVENAARFNRWDSVLGSFDRILNGSFDGDIDTISEANNNNSVAAEAFLMAGGGRNEPQKTPIVNSIEAERDVDKIRIDLTSKSPQNDLRISSDDIDLLPYAPVGYNDSRNMEDLSGRFLEYFSRGVGNLDASRLRVVQPSPSHGTPNNLQPESKETLPTGNTTFPPKLEFHRPITVENLIPESDKNLGNSDDTEHSDSVIKFLTPEDDSEYDTSEGEDNSGGLGNITFVIPKNVSNSSRLSTVLLPDVVRGFASEDDFCQDMLIPPPSDFTNHFINLEDVTAIIDEDVNVGLPSEFTETGSIDDHSTKAPRYFTRTLFSAPDEYGDNPLNPSSFAGRTPGSEPVDHLVPAKSQVAVVLWKPWSQPSQAAESGLSMRYGSGLDNVHDWYDSSQSGILFRVENGSVEFDESEVGVESIV